jgi:hypothetical protein
VLGACEASADGLWNLQVVRTIEPSPGTVSNDGGSATTAGGRRVTGVPRAPNARVQEC